MIVKKDKNIIDLIRKIALRQVLISEIQIKWKRVF